MTVKHSFIFPASKSDVLKKIKELKTLQDIAYLFAIFVTQNNVNELQSEASAVFDFKFKLFGIVSFGIHTINVFWKTIFVYLWAKKIYISAT